MTDTDKLKRRAEAWAACEPMPVLYNMAEDGKAILALVAERNEAVALLHRARVFVELCVDVGELHNDRSGEPTDMFDDITDFLARIDAETHNIS